MSAAPILHISRDGELIRSQTVEGEISIGRAEGNLIRLEDRAISRQHAVLRALTEGVQIEKRSDFGAISVNGSACERAVVKVGDVIAIGPYLLRLEAGKKAIEPLPVPAVPLALVATPTTVIEELPMPTPALRPASDATVVLTPILPANDSESEITEVSLDSPADEDENVGASLAAPIAADTLAADGALDMRGIFDSLNTSAGEAANSGAEAGPSEISMDGLNSFGSPDGPTRAVGDPFALDATGEDDGKTQVQAISVDAKLVLKSGDASPAEFSLTKPEISIGRGKSCDIILNDKKSSRLNTVIVKEGVRYVIRDQGSSNGTYVNGKPVKEKVLSAEDRVRIGECEFIFMAVNPNFAKQSRDFMAVPDAGDSFESPLARPLMPENAANPHPAGPIPASPFGVPGPAPAPAKRGLWKLTDKYIKNFGSLKPVQKLLVVLVVTLFALWFLEESPEDQSAAKSAGQAAGSGKNATGTKSKGMANLTPDQRKFVDTQYNLGFEFYTKKDYDKALYEVQKIFPLVPEHERAKELERYILEAKRMRDAIESERKKKEEEARLKARITSLKQEISGLMDKGQYDEAKERFAEILEIDPEDAEVAEWRSRIDAFVEEQNRVAQEKRVQMEINAAAQDTFNEANALQKAEKFHAAIKVYQRVNEMGSSDHTLNGKAAARVQSCIDAIRERREPALAQARELEKEGKLAEAFRAFESASQIDPPHPDAYAGMDRIRGVLTEQAKALYTEAVIAESYSDFKVAYQKYREILNMAPSGSLYFERATRKIGNYKHFRPEQESETP